MVGTQDGDFSGAVPGIVQACARDAVWVVAQPRCGVKVEALFLVVDMVPILCLGGERHHVTREQCRVP